MPQGVQAFDEPHQMLGDLCRLEASCAKHDRIDAHQVIELLGKFNMLTILWRPEFIEGLEPGRATNPRLLAEGRQNGSANCPGQQPALTSNPVVALLASQWHIEQIRA